MSAKQTPDINNFPGMVAVSQKQFFAVLGKLDVNPRSPRGNKYDRIFGYVSYWTLRNGPVIGKSTGGTPFSNELYMVTESFYMSNRDRFEDVYQSQDQKGDGVADARGIR